MTVPPIAPDEFFLRLIWDPSDIKDGVYQTTTIPTDDLRGPDRGWSVNRSAILECAFINALAADQKTKHPEQALPLMAPVAHRDLLTIHDATGQPELEVLPDPTEPVPNRALPANPAHAVVVSRTGRSRAAAKELKTELLKKLQAPITIDGPYPGAMLPNT
jgi:hypothetical protein